jgi:hypothetical protein
MRQSVSDESDEAVYVVCVVDWLASALSFVRDAGRSSSPHEITAIKRIDNKKYKANRYNFCVFKATLVPSRFVF